MQYNTVHKLALDNISENLKLTPRACSDKRQYASIKGRAFGGTSEIEYVTTTAKRACDKQKSFGIRMLNDAPQSKDVNEKAEARAQCKEAEDRG